MPGALGLADAVVKNLDSEASTNGERVAPECAERGVGVFAFELTYGALADPHERGNLILGEIVLLAQSDQLIHELGLRSDEGVRPALQSLFGARYSVVTC